MVLPANPRIKSNRRTRARLPFVVTETDSRDVRVEEALKVFRKRTGIDPTTDAQLAVLMRWILGGLDENKQPAVERREAREGSHDVEWVATETARGRTPLPRNLTTALQTLVEWLGPADAALALLLFRLHGHEAFILRKTGRDEAFDLRSYLDRLEGRLEQIGGQRAGSLKAKSRSARHASKLPASNTSRAPSTR